MTTAPDSRLLPVAILAGGLATRLRPHTERIPKALLDINGEPFISHQLRLLADQRVTEVVVCTAYLGQMIEDFVGNGRRFGLSVQYSQDGEKLLGTAGALKRAIPLLGDAFFVMYGDSYLPDDFRAIQHKFVCSQRLGLMTVFDNEGQFDASNVEYVDGEIRTYDKKLKSPALRHIDYGLELFQARAFDAVSSDQPQDLATLLAVLLAQGQLASYEVHERFYEIGSLQGWQETAAYLLRQRTLRTGQAVTVDSARQKPSTPAGVPAISRGSSEATPPDTRRELGSDPGGVAAALPAQTAPHSDARTLAKVFCDNEAFRNSDAAGTPAGVRLDSQSTTGGIASLNPRLIDVTPAGVEMKITAPECATERQLRVTGESPFDTGKEVRMKTFTEKFLDEAVEVIHKLDRTAIEIMVAHLAQTRARGGRLFILGVGGSAANASHAVNDFRKIVGIETYAPTDNVSELTARTNDEGWETVFAAWLQGSRLKSDDCLLILSVGGGNVEKNVSANLVAALKYAKQIGSTILGIVGRDGGYTAQVADACVIVPTVNSQHVTPHAEAFQAVIWHLCVTHPALKAVQTKWEAAAA